MSPHHCRGHRGRGLALGDVDADGEVELIAGPNWFKQFGSRWVRYPIALDYELTRAQVGDLSGDGRLDVVQPWLTRRRTPSLPWLYDRGLFDVRVLSSRNICLPWVVLSWGGHAPGEIGGWDRMGQGSEVPPHRGSAHVAACQQGCIPVVDTAGKPRYGEPSTVS